MVYFAQNVKESAMQIQLSTEINSPARTVFLYLTRIEKLIQWQTFLVEAEALSSGVIGVGSKFRNVLRHPGFDDFGVLTLEMIGEVLVYKPEKHLKIQGRSQIADLMIEYRLAQIDDRTIIQQTADFQLQGLLMRSISGLMKGFLTQQFQADLMNLKSLVESEQEASDL